MSETTKKLQAFATRLAEDGYPTALVEQAVIRMDAMETFIVEHQQKEIERLTADLKYYTDTYDKQKAANERLLAKVEQLEAALRQLETAISMAAVRNHVKAALKGADDE